MGRVLGTACWLDGGTACWHDGVMDERKLTVRLDAEMLQRFRIVALKEHKSVSELIREFVEFYVAKKEAQA